jgi:hypothetical protein
MLHETQIFCFCLFIKRCKVQEAPPPCPATPLSTSAYSESPEPEPEPEPHLQCDVQWHGSEKFLEAILRSILTLHRLCLKVKRGHLAEGGRREDRRRKGVP